MELSKFLQQDIIDFLERKSSEQREQRGKLRNEELSIFSVDKDYAKETDEALENENYAKAKKIFDNLREAYNNLKGDDEQREKVYAILEEVYAKIKEGIKGKKSLEEDLATFEKGMEVLQRKGDAASVFDKEAMSAEQEREAAERKLKSILKDINECLEKKDVRKAIDNYNQLKEAFQKYPAEDKYRKIDWYNQVLGTYEQIRRLQQQLAATAAARKNETAKKKQEEESRKKKEAEEKKKQEEEAAREQLVSQHLKKVKDEIKDLISSLDQGDLKRTTSLLMDARHKVAKLDKQFDNEKTALEGILATVTHRIEFLKRQQKEEAEKEKELAEQRAKEEAVQAEKAAEEKKRREEEMEKERAIGDANNAEELYHKGLQYQHEGKLQEAKACYRAILKITPHHLPAQIRLEQLEEHQGGKNNANAQS